MKRATLALAATASLVMAREAAASSGYPMSMQTDLDLDTEPGCDVCHAEAEAKVGAVTKPFGKSLVKLGLRGDDDASLGLALQRMAKDHIDSDGDGQYDLDELSYGGDPNHAAVPIGGNELPVTYGCAVRAAEGSPAPVAASLGALALVAGWRRRSAGAR